MPSSKLIVARASSRFRRFWSFPIATMLFAAVIAVAYLSIRTPKYDVTMVVAPAEIPGQSPKSLLGLGSAASLLSGGGLGGGDANLERLQETLVSPIAAEKLNPNGPLFHELYSGEWNSSAERWQAPQGIFAGFRRSVSEALGKEPWGPPGPARFAEDMKGMLIFSAIGKSDMLRISMRTEKPKFAVKLLTALHLAADSLIRDSEKRRVTAYLDYLNHEIPKVTTAENRSALGDLILEQQRQLMSLSADNITFASDVVEPPTVPYKPLGLSPLVLLLAYMIVGFIFGSVVIYIWPSGTNSPFSLGSWKYAFARWFNGRRETEQGMSLDQTV